MEIEIRTLTGAALRQALPELARLRITVFRDWPYLYDGSLDYEARYLTRYENTDGAVIVGAYDRDRLVGAATGEPMADEAAAFRQPLAKRGYDLGAVFYLAESVLDPAYRGQGIGHRFFDERERHARRLGFTVAVFCAVIRADTHAMRPAAYRPLDPFWRKRGYAPLDGAIVHFPWRDIGETQETDKAMQMWMRKL